MTIPIEQQLADHLAKVAKKLEDNRNALSPAKYNEMKERLKTFQFRVLGLILCPECHIVRNKSVTMRGGTFQVGKGVEIFRCPTCKYDVLIEWPASDLPYGVRRF